MNHIIYVIIVVCTLGLGCKGAASTSPQTQPSSKTGVEGKAGTKNFLEETPQAKAARMAWWKEARFGMFIHWGLYAVPAGVYQGKKVPRLGEWIMHYGQIPIPEYEKFAKQFNPVEFNADEWVRIAKEAGVKYIVITSKHHDGFALYDSKISDWDVIDRTPFGRDILKELSEACARADMPLGFYYSIMDWHHQDAQGTFFPEYNDRERESPSFMKYAENYMKPQIKELLAGYGDLKILWFDGQWIADWDGDRGRELYNFVRNIKPDILINNRVGRDKQLPDTCQEEVLIGDFGTPEQYIPSTGVEDMDWESCLTMNDTWGFKADDHNWKEPELLIRMLIDVVSKGGNMLLNVGPTALGTIPDPSVDRLMEIGEWLNVFGESIYGAEASPWRAPRWGRFTQKDQKIYAHLFFWPSDGKFYLPKPKGPIESVYLLSDPQKQPLKYEVVQNRGQAGVMIEDLPLYPPHPAASVIVIETQK